MGGGVRCSRARLLIASTANINTRATGIKPNQQADAFTKEISQISALRSLCLKVMVNSFVTRVTWSPSGGMCKMDGQVQRTHNQNTCAQATVGFSLAVEALLAGSSVGSAVKVRRSYHAWFKW
jgi:hypothetical protein